MSFFAIPLFFPYLHLSHTDTMRYLTSILAAAAVGGGVAAPVSDNVRMNGNANSFNGHVAGEGMPLAAKATLASENGHKATDAQIRHGATVCFFGVDGNTGTTNPFGHMSCSGAATPEFMEKVDQLHSALEKSMGANCGDAEPKECAPMFLYGMLSYLKEEPTRWAGKDLPNWSKQIKVTKTTKNFKEQGAHEHDDERKRGHTCSDPYLGSLSTPHPYEPNCPMWGNHVEADDGALCMCPYGGGGWWWAWYDTTRYPYQLDWLRQKGSDTPECTGRCGAGCNFFDKEAFWDCFEHDTCLDHVGGSILGDNSNCGDEFNHAADDYIISYGWGCC